MELLFKSVEDFYLRHASDKTYWIAYSGGLDSHVLLHLFSKLQTQYPIQLRAVYVNHGLSSRADQWATHCKKICADLQINFHEKKIHATAEKGQSREEVAREKRYDVFHELLEKNDFLITAHHQHDQAETLLLQMLRGAGPKGLAAMPGIKPFAKGLHARPLLSFSRDVLKNYAEKNQLQWIEDESNSDTSFSRNFIRHEILPLLKKRWPSVTETLARSSGHCADAQNQLEKLAQKDFENAQVENALSIKKLLLLDPLRQSNVLREWFAQLNIPLPSTIKMQHILSDVLLARNDKNPCFSWKNIELRRYRDNLYVMQKLNAFDNKTFFTWDFSEDLKIPSGVLRAHQRLGEGLRADIQQVTVRFRQGGEACRLPGRKHHHALKKLFQEWNILPWERDRVPLVFVNEELAVIPGLFVSDEYAAKQNEPGVVLEFHHLFTSKLRFSSAT